MLKYPIYYQIFNELKETLKDVYEGEDDVYLLRFLVARCWDLSISEQMFRDTKVRMLKY